MERRWSPRTPITARVELENPDSGRINCEARDISMEGMYLGTDQPGLSRNQRVRAHFTLDVNGQPRAYTIGASVVHTTPGGIGLRFRDLDVRLCRHLNQLLYSSAEQDRSHRA